LYLSTPVASHHYGECSKIKDSEDDLAYEDVLSVACQSVEDPIDVHVQTRIDQWTSITFNLVVVALSFQVDINLLHVCDPVYFGICEELDA
jgi:hypothetical protein